MSETNKEKAARLFREGYNCAQSVFVAYADRYGIDEKTALKLASSFGGGMGRMREVCGCVSGMLMIAGMETGSTEGQDAAGKARNYETVQQMAEQFKQKSGGSIICKELLGLTEPEGSPNPAPRTNTYYQKRPCAMLVQDACDIIESTFQ